MKKTSILYVEENQDGTVGGSHYQLLDLIRTLDSSKFRITVIFSEQTFIIDSFKEVADKVIVFKKPRCINIIKYVYGNKILFGFLKPIQVVTNILISLIYPSLIYTFLILKHKIDLVHLNDTVFSGTDWCIAVKLTLRKIISHERGIHVLQPGTSIPFHVQYFDHILGVSESTKQNLQQFFNVNSSKYTTFYDRIDVDRFKSRISKTRNEVIKELALPPCTYLFAIIGNIKRWKGQHVIIDAAKILSDLNIPFHCLIVGDVSKRSPDDMDYFKGLQGQIKKHHLESMVTLTGPRNDVPDIINALDILIHCSTLPEPFGMVILEGMSLGKPVIATAHGGPLEIIENNLSGLFYEKGNHQMLAAHICQLIKNPQTIDFLGKNAALRIAEKFSKLDTIFIEKLYKSLAG